MTPENLEKVLEKIIDNKFEYYELYLFISIAITVIVSIISSYVISYLTEKGKNLATTEDTHKITKIVEDIKNENSEKLESIKNENLKSFNLIQNKNDARFSELKNTKDRFNSKQFEIYNTLWSSLIELKFSADTLWDSATQKNLKDFSTKVSEAKKTIEMSSLLLENTDYHELILLIKSFNNFQFGKGLLLEKVHNKTIADFKDKHVDEKEISDTIEINKQIKEEYDTLINKLKEKFKAQIQGKNKGQK